MANYNHIVMPNDQAAGLRRIMAKPKPRIVSVLSASSTQAQPRLITNLAATMVSQGNEVLVMHASEHAFEHHYELAQSPTLLDVISDTHTLAQAIKTTTNGYASVKLMHKSLFKKANDAHSASQLNLLFNQLAQQYDIVLVDTMLNADSVLPLHQLNESEIIIQLSRKPESITEAYSLIKQVCGELGRRSFGIIVDDSTDAQAQIVFGNIAQVAKRYMQIELEFFGAIPADSHISRASKLGRSVIDAFPLAMASTALKQIAQRLDYKHDNIFNNKQAQLS
ncbi:MinD/ParA family ATP-binding protein [Methylotenera mobilis]|uniref:MotR n=1 Tax=Methylotenera mobilis (strain JLW8 / ATCC BAA-1282 / DSM 17540) TaxID=583345 RepID=C6WW77_METML|nr:MotR protein [Methylotenera mobilis]ACT48176.1 MotR [Methylotenera mobilis JLW8]